MNLHSSAGPSVACFLGRCAVGGENIKYTPVSIQTVVTRLVADCIIFFMKPEKCLPGESQLAVGARSITKVLVLFITT